MKTNEVSIQDLFKILILTFTFFFLFLNLNKKKFEKSEIKL